MRVESIQHIQDLVWLKLESTQEKLSSGAYDCLGIYKHSDMSYEWRPCRIMRRELKANLEKSNECYWIEFLHCRDQGMWFKRNYKDVLLSVDYTRYQLGNFKKECLDFCKKLYD